jgi:hypothetical protein
MRQETKAKPTTLRRTVDAVTVLVALGLLGALGAYEYQQAKQESAVRHVADDVQRFRQMLQLRSATKDVPLNARGWPMTIDPAWFEHDPPRNVLVTPDRPWVEVAAPGDAELQDPVVRMTISPALASFWYNPYQGIIRARVSVGINDERALTLYNRINGTTLDSIYTKQPPKPTKPAVEAAAPPEPPAATTAEVPTHAEPAETPSLDPTVPLPPAPSEPPHNPPR